MTFQFLKYDYSTCISYTVYDSAVIGSIYNCYEDYRRCQITGWCRQEIRSNIHFPLIFNYMLVYLCKYKNYINYIYILAIEQIVLLYLQ